MTDNTSTDPADPAAPNTDPADDSPFVGNADATPAAVDPLFVNNDEPAPGPMNPVSVEPAERARRAIVNVLLLVLFLIVLAGLVGWLLYGDEDARMQNFALITSPVITLIGTMMGFYFNSKK